MPSVTDPRPAASSRPGQRERSLGMLGELRSHDDWPRERLLDHQRARLRALLEHAVTSSPYHRQRLGSDGPDAPLHELPTLSKAR